MPGKVNPVIPEAVNQIAFQVIGNDLTVTMASEAVSYTHLTLPTKRIV